MGLVDLVYSLPQEIRPIIILAHVNHQLRPESEKEEQDMKEWARNKHLTLHVYRWEKAEHPSAGIEEAARNVRYRFFERVMKKEKASKLLTAHHANDQAETVLMKLVRGGFLEQFTGMDRVRPFGEGQLLRPLLYVSKQELYAYAAEEKLFYNEDKTNDTLDYSRNRYRNQVLPLLREENEKAEEHLIDFSNDLSDLLTATEPLLFEKSEGYITENTSGFDLNRGILNELPAFRRILLSILLKRMGHYSATSFKRKHVFLLLDWIEHAAPNSQFNLPDRWLAKKSYKKIQFLHREEKEKTKSSAFLRQLHLGEWVHLPSGESIGLIPEKKQADQANNEKEEWVLLDPEKVSLPLRVRHRKNGDRLQLKGGGGTKKVKDIFIDQKVPLKDRDRAWVVEDQTGRILWLVGYKESVLSLGKRTDRMMYMLIMKKENLINKRSHQNT